jgi:Recombinase
MLAPQSGGAEVMAKHPFTGVTNEVRQARADKRAADLVPVVKELHAAGVTSLRAIAAALDKRGIPTETGGRWHHTQVRRLLARLSA